MPSAPRLRLEETFDSAVPTGTFHFAPSQPTGSVLGLLELDAGGLGCCRPTGYPETRSAAASAPPAG